MGESFNGREVVEGSEFNHWNKVHFSNALKDFGIEHMNAGKVGWDQRATRAPAHHRQPCHRWAGAAYQPLVPPYGAFASISGFSTSGCRGWANAGFRRNVENISPQATDPIRIRRSIFIGIPFLR